MSANRGTLQQIAGQLAGALRPLEEGFRDPDAFRVLLYELGWEVDGLPPSYVAVADKAVQAGTALRALADDAGPGETVAVIGKAGEVYRAIGALTEAPGGIAPATFLPELGRRLFELLLGRQLLAEAPQWFAMLQALGIIALEDTPETDTRPGFTRLRFDWDQIPAILRDPSLVPERVYGWGTPHLKFTKIAELVGQLANAAGLPTSMDRLSPALANALQPGAGASAARTTRPALTAVLFDLPVDGTYVEVGVMLTELVAEGDRLPGVILQPLVPNGIDERIDLGGGWAFVLRAGTDLAEQLAIAIRPDGVEARYPFRDGQPPPRASLGVSLTYDAATPLLVFGQPDRTRLEVAAISLGLSADGAIDDLELKASAEMRDLALVVSAKNTDGFLSSVLGGKDVRVALQFALSWSSRTGLDMLAGGGVAATVFPHTQLGGIRIDRVDLAIEAAAGTSAVPALQARASATISGALGPVAFSVDRLGARLPMTFADGNAGPFDVGLEPLLPTGVGLVVDASVVVGGGFLFFDPEKEEYGGILQLEVADTIALTAIGLLTTRLTDGSSGFSLVVIISAEGFAPIQLGFGFMLCGVGGLLGINRTVKTDVLRTGLKNQTLGSILFPADPVRNAPQIISDLRTVFPAVRGRHVFGPMALITWGVPTLLTLEIGVLIELPEPVRVVILGRLQALLPDAERALVRVRMDAIGIIDFDTDDVSLDATLYDSRILSFVLTGDMALRANWGRQPNFVLAIGGFNPRFPAPAGFPVLARLALSLGDGGNPRLRLACYLALTSNTVQFGARLDLSYSSSGFTLVGFLAFDALFQFSPFQFVVDIGASVALKRGGSTLMSVSLEMTLAGPTPWHVRGKAKFKIFFFSVTIKFDHRFGQGTPPPLPAPVDVLALLGQAVGDRRNWSSALPRGEPAIVSLRDTTTGGARVHPLAELTLRQRLVPLNRPITKFGNTPLATATVFTVTVAGTESTPVQDAFALAQFEDMSDEEKLTRPAFEQQDAGLHLGAAAPAFEYDALPDSGIAYETLIIDPTRPPDPEPVRQRYVLPADVLDAVVGLGAAGDAPIRRRGRSRYRPLDDVA